MFTAAKQTAGKRLDLDKGRSGKWWRLSKTRKLKCKQLMRWRETPADTSGRASWLGNTRARVDEHRCAQKPKHKKKKERRLESITKLKSNQKKNKNWRTQLMNRALNANSGQEVIILYQGFFFFLITGCYTIYFDCGHDGVLEEYFSRW